MLNVSVLCESEGAEGRSRRCATNVTICLIRITRRCTVNISLFVRKLIDFRNHLHNGFVIGEINDYKVNPDFPTCGVNEI